MWNLEDIPHSPQKLLILPAAVSRNGKDGATALSGKEDEISSHAPMELVVSYGRGMVGLMVGMSTIGTPTVGRGDRLRRTPTPDTTGPLGSPIRVEDGTQVFSCLCLDSPPYMGMKDHLKPQITPKRKLVPIPPPELLVLRDEISA